MPTGKNARKKNTRKLDDFCDYMRKISGSKGEWDGRQYAYIDNNGVPTFSLPLKPMTYSPGGSINLGRYQGRY